MPSTFGKTDPKPPVNLAPPDDQGEAAAATYQGHCANISRIIAASIAAPGRVQLDDMRAVVGLYLELTGADVAAGPA